MNPKDRYICKKVKTTKSKTYRCNKTKDQILEIVAKHFYASNELQTGSPEEWAVYHAMCNLVHELGITEVE